MPTHASETQPSTRLRSGPVGEREILITRELDAPRELVWAAFTDPRHVDRWWGPRGFTVETVAIDVRVGGRWRFVMRGEGGKEYTNRIEYRELRAPERLAYDHGSDVDDDPARFAVTITFEQLGAGRTRVVMRSLFSSAAQRDGVVGFGAVELGESTLAKGADHVARSLFVETDPTRPTVATLRRLLHAPRALVWEAMTRPEHIARWYGPRGTTVGECRVDLRVGGEYRFVVRTPRGEHGFGGTYREIVPGERIVQTWAWDGAPGASSVESMRLVDLGERTLVVVDVEHASAEALAMHLEHGMEAGASETYARLDELLQALARLAP